MVRKNREKKKWREPDRTTVRVKKDEFIRRKVCEEDLPMIGEKVKAKRERLKRALVCFLKIRVSQTPRI